MTSVVRAIPSTEEVEHSLVIKLVNIDDYRLRRTLVLLVLLVFSKKVE